MKKQDTLRNFVIAVGVFLLLMAVAPRLFPPPPPRDVPVASQRDTSAPPTSAASSSSPAQEPTASERSTSWTVIEAADEQTLAIGAELSDGLVPESPASYRMLLTLSNIGASVESATLTDHAQTLHSEQRYELLSPIACDDGSPVRSLLIERLNIDSDDIELSQRKWHVGPTEPYSSPQRGNIPAEEGMAVAFWLELHHHDQAALKLTRVYRLPRQPQDQHRRDLHTELRIDNLSDRSHDVVISYRGGVGTSPANPRQDDRVIDFGIAEAPGNVLVTRKTFAQAFPKNGNLLNLFRPSPAEPNVRFSWAATANNYFTCTVAPLDAQYQDAPGYIADVSAVDLDGNPITLNDVSIRFITSVATVPSNGSSIYPTSIYLGEKDPASFKKVPEYARRNYYDQITLGFGWCTFTWLVEVMIWLLNGLHYIVRDYGVAIIILVLIVRTLLHPITKKGQVNMVRMQQRMGEFAPKMEELKRKFGNDKTRLQQETMKLYREQGINPATNMLGCLPLFLQMPIWVALFLSLSNNIRMRHEGFLFTWIHDLTAPDALITFSHALTVPIFGWQIASLNLLPPLVSLFMYIQQKTQPKPKPNPNMTEQQRQQQDAMKMMMPLMCIMMLFFFYNGPSGLNLYIMFSSLFGWIEQTRIRAHIRAHEEAGTLLKPPPKPPAAEISTRKHRDQMSWLERLQKMAEEAHKARPKRAADKKRR